MKRSFGAIAVVAALIVPQAAQAETVYQWEKVTIPAGETRTVQSTGKIILNLHEPKVKAAKLTCALKGRQALWNDGIAGQWHGESQTVAFNVTKCATNNAGTCASPVVTALLPWGTQSLRDAPEEPLPVEWPGVALEVSCVGVDQGAFSGTLTVKIGDNDGAEKEKEVGHCDDVDNHIEFSGRDGVLSGPEGKRIELGASSYVLGTRALKNKQPGRGASGRTAEPECYPTP